MNTTQRSIKGNIATALCSSILLAGLARADIAILAEDPHPGAGIGYRWTVQMDDTASGSFFRHVGAWSWEDNSLFNAGNGEPPVGWTHTSDWVALDLTAPALFSLRLERQENVPWPSAEDPNRVASVASMFPSFTIWEGWQETGSDSHTYNNRGDVSWAPDISYIAHLDNSTLTSIDQTFSLAAGKYSIVLGSNAPANDTNRQGYLATFSTQVVPEPGSAALLFTGVGFLYLLRRRIR